METGGDWLAKERRLRSQASRSKANTAGSMQTNGTPNRTGNAEVKGKAETFDFVGVHLNSYAVCGSLGNLATFGSALLTLWFSRRRSQQHQLSCSLEKEFPKLTAAVAQGFCDESKRGRSASVGHVPKIRRVLSQLPRLGEGWQVQC